LPASESFLITRNPKGKTVKSIPLIKPDLPVLDDVAESFREILENGKITNFSKYVTKFEEEASDYLNAHALTVSSGTMGLVFALHSLGLQKGQKVILPSFTFMATAQAVLYAGGIPVFVDVENDLTLSPSDLADLLEKHDNVGGVIGTHVYGMPCQVEKLQEIVEDFSRQKSRPIFLLYDAAGITCTRKVRQSCTQKRLLFMKGAYLHNNGN